MVIYASNPLPKTIPTYVFFQEIVLSPDSKSYAVWKTPPMPINFDIYLYNWTNPTNFTQNEFVKPILEQIGPYRFKENMDKTDIDWNSQNATVSFRKMSTYFFDETGSIGKLDDVITTLNIIALVSSFCTENWFINENNCN